MRVRLPLRSCQALERGGDESRLTDRPAGSQRLLGAGERAVQVAVGLVTAIYMLRGGTGGRSV